MRNTLLVVFVLIALVAVVVIGMRVGGPAEGAVEGGEDEMLNRVTGKVTTTFLELDTMTLLLLSVFVGLVVWWVVLH